MTDTALGNTTMTGAELKVLITGLGLTPVWLGDRLNVATRTAIRWFDADEVPAEVVAEVEAVVAITDEEMRRQLHAAHLGPLRTQRTDRDAPDWQREYDLPAAWHRALTFRVLNQMRANGSRIAVTYT